MDWTKAKTILIVALLATNIILIAVYGHLAPASNTTDQELETETIALLADKGIYIKGSLPLKHNNMPVLSVEYDRLDPNLLQEQLWDQIPIDENDRSRQSMLELANHFLEKCGVLTDTVELESVNQTGTTTTVTYRNVYQEILVEDSYIICTIEGGQVVKMDRYWAKPVEFGRTKRATISPSAALISIVSEKHELGSVMVEKVEMVYWLDPTNYGGENTVSDTAFPAWKITYNDGQVIHVPAYLE
jgi:hypothetical protein